MNDFFSFGLSKPVLDNLQKLNFTTPTPIQQQAIPAGLEGKDILGSAQTGTGKTAAFSIPLVEHLIKNPGSQALIITPTRELAFQVITTLKDLLPQSLLKKSTLLIGGEPIGKQLAALRRKPRIIVGTPGRLTDHLNRQSLNLSQADFLVLDETDRMLDMGFTDDINTIVQSMAQQRQTLLFSATLPPAIERVAQKYLTNPVRIAIQSKAQKPTNIEHNVMYMSHQEKYDSLLDQLEQREGSVIVFVNTKISAANMAEKLRKEQHFADAMHGDLRQNKRSRVIKNFRNKKYRIMVATDIAARGLDIPHIKHVINYDLPQCPEDYIHRIGRTARAEKSGQAVCFVTPREKSKWREIDVLMHPEKATKEDHRRAGQSRFGGGSSSRSSRNSKFKKRRPFAAKDNGDKPRRFKKYKGSYAKRSNHSSRRNAHA